MRETEAYTLGVQTVLWGLQWVKAGASLRHWAAPLPGGGERLPIDPMPHGYNFFGHAEFMPGKVFGTGTMQPIDYFVELAEKRIPPPLNLDIATIQQQELAMGFRLHIPQYLSRGAADWKERGFTETLVDFPALNARFNFWGDDQRSKRWYCTWLEMTGRPRNAH